MDRHEPRPLVTAVLERHPAVAYGRALSAPLCDATLIRAVDNNWGQEPLDHHRGLEDVAMPAVLR